MKNEINYLILEKDNIRRIKFYRNKLEFLILKIYYRLKNYKIY